MAMVTAQSSLTHRGTPEPALIEPAETSASVMIPMVFWASLLPWLYAMSADETTSSLRKNLLACLGVQSAKSSKMIFMIKKPRQRPMSGEVKRGMTTFSRTPAHATSFVEPVKTTVAPMRLPMSAWLELDGIERHHVKKSHMTAPISAARMT